MKTPVFKIEMYIVDPNHNYPLGEYQIAIENSLDGSAISGMVTWGDCKRIEVDENIESFDDSRFNKVDGMTISDYRKLFKK